ncbi:MAG: zinc-binding alcohol dehydrogenase [Deltaproteobacteria bacterium]|nr:zinc-binding alcohol dehydrogenase [Deltaproteobacteria bacterium]
MKAAIIRRYGGPEVLEFTDVAPPVPKDDEVVVKVHAASINPIDWQIREGLVKMFIRPKFPAILGCDLAGEIVEVGKAATRLKVGDRVFAMMPHDWGAQAELVALPERLVALKPDNLTMVEAGSVGATAVTAVHALRDSAKLTAGKQVLVNGASGGVGIFAVQVAKDLGAHVTAVCGAASFDLVKSLGADVAIDYKTTDFTKSQTQFDVVFDCIGNQPHGACKPVMRGKWVHLTTMPKGKAFLRSLLNPLTKTRVVPMIAKATPDRIEYIRSALETGRLKTVVDKVFPTASIVEAQAYSKAGRAKGKIVLTFER